MTRRALFYILLRNSGRRFGQIVSVVARIRALWPMSDMIQLDRLACGMKALRNSGLRVWKKFEGFCVGYHPSFSECCCMLLRCFDG